MQGGAGRRGLVRLSRRLAERGIPRTHGPMVEEGRRIVQEGIAASEADIDVVWTHGYGFPDDPGGPGGTARAAHRRA